MLYNTIMIILVLIAAGMLLYMFYRRTNAPEIAEEYDNPYTVDIYA